MLTLIMLLLLASFVLFVVSFRAPAPGYVDRAAFGCLLVAVALLAFGDRILH